MGRLDLSVAVAAIGDTLTLTYPSFVETHIMDKDFIVRLAPKRTDLVLLGHPKAFTVINWTKETALGATSAADLVSRITELVPAPTDFLHRFAVTNYILPAGVPTPTRYDQALGVGISKVIGSAITMPDTTTVRIHEPGLYVIKGDLVYTTPAGFDSGVSIIEQDGVRIGASTSYIPVPNPSRWGEPFYVEVTTTPTDLQILQQHSPTATNANFFFPGFDLLTVFRHTR